MEVKKIVCMALPLVLALALTACGGGGGDIGATDSAPQVGGEIDNGWDVGVDGAEMAEGEGPRPMPDVSSAKMIYTADLSLETREFEPAMDALDQIVADLGGYFEARNLYQGGTYRSLDCVIRVPAENFTSLLDRAGSAAHVTSRNEYSDNVSEDYYDNEARLATQRAKLERLQELLGQAETMEEIVALESALSDTELQIEYLTGNLRHYDSLIGYSTVNLSLQEVYRLSNDQELPETFAQRLGAAFADGWDSFVSWLENFAVALAHLWPGVLLLAAVASAAVLVHRRRAGNGAKNPPPSKPKDGDGGDKQP